MSEWLNKAAGTFTSKGLRQAVRGGCFVGEIALALMMFATAADVTGRYVFAHPIKGVFDLTAYWMAIHVAGGWAYCAITDGHVKVDIVLNRMSQRAQVICNSFFGFLSFVFIAIVTWRIFALMSTYIYEKTASTETEIVTWPFTGLVGIGMALLSLVLLADFLVNLSKAVKK